MGMGHTRVWILGNTNPSLGTILEAGSTHEERGHITGIFSLEPTTDVELLVSCFSGSLWLSHRTELTFIWSKGDDILQNHSIFFLVN